MSKTPNIVRRGIQGQAPEYALLGRLRGVGPVQFLTFDDVVTEMMSRGRLGQRIQGAMSNVNGNGAETGKTLAEWQVFDGAVNQYKLDETSGTTAFDSVGGANASYIITSGDVSLGAPTIAKGETASAVLNRGVVRMPFIDPPDDATSGAFAIEWIMDAFFTPDAAGSFPLSNAHADTTADGFQVGGSGAVWNGNLTINFTSGRKVVSVWQMLLGAMYHVVLNYDGTNIDVWINGQFLRGAPSGGGAILPGVWNMTLGNNTNFGVQLSHRGRYQDLAFYDQALTAEQIQTHFQSVTYG